MELNSIKHVCVAGCGTMGRQIAMNAAIYGYDVKIYDLSEASRENARKWSEEYLQGRIDKGRMTAEQVEDIKSRFNILDSLEAAASDADLVIETIVEIEDVKRSFLKQVSAIVREDTILASNSSYMPTSLFANDVVNPGRMANLHYSNPAIVMKMAEIASGEHTKKETVDTLMEFARSVGKVPVWIRKEIDGFIGNRIKRCVDREARWLVENGYCTPQDVDTVLETGYGYPKGPFRLLDMTGVDLAFVVLREKYEKTGIKDPGYDMLEKMYNEGRWGVKSGKGFYDYTDNK